MDYPLSGMRVLDLSRVLAGPYCTMLLTDFGAEVIKVEQPGKGDDSRAFGPFLPDNESAYFMSINRGKKSIVLNLKERRGREIFWELVKKSDVLVENYRPGTMENLGLGYEAIKEVNPGLIYAAISGFGHSGPYSRRAAYDMVVQAMGGLMSITGHPDGPPVRVGTSVGDITAALFAVIGILLACAQRRKTGLGQKLDVAMLDTQVAILENAVVRCDLTGEVPQPLGTRHPSITPFQAYPTKDYYIIIAGGNDALFRKMCVAMGLEKCLDDPRFSSNNLRNRNIDALEEFISMVSVTKTTEEWLAVLTEAGVPAAPINTIDKVLTDPQVLARDMINETVYPGLEKALRFAGNPIKLSRTPPLAHKKSPLLGEHGLEILSECLGFDEQSIEAYVNGITNNGPVV